MGQNTATTVCNTAMGSNVNNSLLRHICVGEAPNDIYRIS